ncbi:MAG TPA: hypothetical protein DCQ14_07010, partial [Firmicutes bacterium]|nr:hypothetical protein [Bacillota bacterium]
TPRTKAPPPPGAEYVSAGKPANTAGVTRTSQIHIQNTVDKNHLQVITRHTTPRAKALIESGQALPKRVDIKAKTLDKRDELLGGPKNSEGLVGYFDPKLPPKEVMDMLSPQEKKELLARYKARWHEYRELYEYRELVEDMKSMTGKGGIKIVDGLVIDVKTGKPFTGDVDLLELRNYDGSPLTLSQKKRYLDDLMGQRGSNVMHGDVMSWAAGDKGFDPQAKADMLRDAMEGGKGVNIFSPNAAPVAAHLR